MHRTLIFSLVSILVSTAVSIGQEPVSNEPDLLAPLDWMIGKWISDEQPMEQDIPGIGKKGEMSRMHVTIERTLGGKFLAGSGAVHRGDKSVEVFRELWGPSTATNSIHRWFFDADGLMVEGEIAIEGDTTTHHIKGDALTAKVLATNDNAEFKKLIEKLGLSKLPYTAEAVFRRIDDSTMSVKVQNVKIGGIPVPTTEPVDDVLHKVE